MSNKDFFLTAFFFLMLLMGCQTPTTVTQTDFSEEARVFSKVRVNDQVELRKSVIIDVRPRFEHELSRPPRSFHAYWKDWDLRGLSGKALKDKAYELQRLLALKGIEPYSHVVVFGKGLKGRGEEFLVATTLISLGVERISFMTDKQFKNALVAKNLPKMENAPYWNRPVSIHWNCTEKAKPDILISPKGKGRDSKSVFVSQVFDDKLNVLRKTYSNVSEPKILSPNGHWSYGLVLYLRRLGKKACVL